MWGSGDLPITLHWEPMWKRSLLCVLRVKLEQLGPRGRFPFGGKESDTARSRHPVTWAGTKHAVARDREARQP